MPNRNLTPEQVRIEALRIAAQFHSMPADLRHYAKQYEAFINGEDEK